MSAQAIADRLSERGIRPSAQRVAIAEFVLTTESHPAADAIWAAVKRRFPMVSRATVYNTLNLFVEQGLLRALPLASGRVVYDPNMTPHHHFVDDDDGSIRDLPWESLTVHGVDGLRDVAVREHSVIVRGTRRSD